MHKYIRNNMTLDITEEYIEEENKIKFSGEILWDKGKRGLRQRYLPLVSGKPAVSEFFNECKTEDDEMIEIENYTEVLDKYGVDLY